MATATGKKARKQGGGTKANLKKGGIKKSQAWRSRKGPKYQRRTKI